MRNAWPNIRVILLVTVLSSTRMLGGSADRYGHYQLSTTTEGTVGGETLSMRPPSAGYAGFRSPMYSFCRAACSGGKERGKRREVQVSEEADLESKARVALSPAIRLYALAVSRSMYRLTYAGVRASRSGATANTAGSCWSSAKPRASLGLGNVPSPRYRRHNNKPLQPQS